MINNESVSSTQLIDDKSSDLREEEDQEHTNKKLIVASIQTAGSFLLELAPNTITLYFLSRTNNNLWISAFGIGMTWANCLGMGPLNALAVGQETLISQAYGSEKFKLCGQLFYRTIFADILMMIPVFFLMFFGGDILYAMNGNLELSMDAGHLTKFLILQIFLDGVHVTTKCLLNGQNIYKYIYFIIQTIQSYQVYSQVATASLHILWSYLFIEFFQLGLLGCALAKTTTDFLNPLFLFTIIKITGCSDKTLVHFEFKQLVQTFAFFKAAFPIGSLLWLEWVCYEFYSIQASYLEESQITANEVQFIMTNFVTLYYQFSYGCSIAASTLVGYQMGNQSVRLAQKFSIVSFYIIGSFLLISQVLFYFFRYEFYGLFTRDQLVEQQLENSIWSLSLLCILDGFQAYLTGIVRAIGRETFACISFVFFYLGVGQLLAYFLAFPMGYGLQGIWIGMVVGAGGYDLLQIINLICSNWEGLLLEIQKKLDKQENYDRILVEDY